MPVRLLCVALLVLPILVLFCLSPVRAQPFTYAEDCVSNVDNATVQVSPSDSLTLPGDVPIEAGDTLAVYTEDGTCAGYDTWTAEGAIVSAAGPDSMESSDGYSLGETLKFEVYDVSSGTVTDLDSSVTYQSCAGDVLSLCRDDGRYANGTIHQVSGTAQKSGTGPYALSVATEGSGTVTKSPDQSEYAAGTTVELTAKPDSGWTFAGWSGAASDTTNPVTVTVDADTSVTANFVESDTIRLNAGGDSYTDESGRTWSADQYGQGGQTYSNEVEIAGTSEDALYQSERYGDFTYELPVTSGTYAVRLHFAEIFWGVEDGSGEPGDRVFDVTVEGGQATLSDYDIIADVGEATAAVKTFEGIEVTDGALTIRVETEVDNAKISAIEVVESTSVELRASDSRPVKMSAFTASLDGTAAVLTWKTESETENAGFEVQHRGPDAADYTALGFVEDAGSTSQSQPYQHRVEALPPGDHQFRLRQVDTDGSSSFTEPVRVTVRAERKLALYATGPNPTRRRTQLAFTVEQSGPVEMILYNVLGQQVKVLYDQEVSPGARHSVDVLVDGLSSGTYFARLYAPSGTKTQRVIVVR